MAALRGRSHAHQASRAGQGGIMRPNPWTVDGWGCMVVWCILASLAALVVEWFGW